jgi:hypothetical protein
MEGFEYSGSGTFFFAKHAGKFYGITAKHCLRGRDKETIRLFVQDGPEGEELVPICRLHLIEDPPAGMEDWADLAFMELRDESLTPDQKNAAWFVDLDHLIGFDVKLGAGDLLVTRGCPNCIGEIDYESKKIRHGFFGVDGIYAGPGIDSRTHIFQFSDLSQIENPNGMSGSPVFKLTKWFQGMDYWFVGVILRSTKESGIARFVDCGVIFHALQKLRDI